MNSEINRLESLRSWSVTFIDKNFLALIGFYQSEIRSDVVVCHFCNIEIGFFEEGDDPLQDHVRWSPSCQLMRRCPTDNIPIDAHRLDNVLPPIGSRDIADDIDVADSEGVIGNYFEYNYFFFLSYICFRLGSSLPKPTTLCP